MNRDRSRIVLAASTGPRAATAAVLLLAFGLRLARLDFQPLWWDEGYTIYFATSSLAEMLERTAVDIHPPFYYLLLQGWIPLAGAGPFAVRMLSVILGTLTVALVGTLGRRLLSRPAGLLAAFLTAISPFFIYYSQEARMYALASLLGAASTYAMWELLEGRGSRRRRAALAAVYLLVTTAAMYTLYYAAFVPLFQTLFVLWRARRYRGAALAWLGGQAVLAFLYLPWALYAGGRLQEYVRGKVDIEAYSSLGPLEYVAKYISAFSVGHLGAGNEWLAWGAAVFLGVAAALPFLWQARSKGGLALLGLYLGVPLLAGYLINVIYPFDPVRAERLLLVAAPAYLLLVGAGLWEVASLATAGRRSQWLGALGFVAALAGISSLSLAGFYSQERYPGEDYRPLIARVNALGRLEDAVLCVYPWQIGYFRAYGSEPSPEMYAVPSERWGADIGSLRADLDAVAEGHPRLWLPAYQAQGRMLEGDIQASLDDSAYLALREWHGTTLLSFYSTEDDPPMQAADLSAGKDLGLEAAGIGAEPLEAGWGVARLALQWRRGGGFDEELRLRLRLVDPVGRVWAESDRPLTEEGESGGGLDRRGLLVPAGAPPGSYEIVMGIYRELDGEWLELRGGRGEALGSEVALGEVRVVDPQTPPPPSSLPIRDRVEAELGGKLRLLGYTLGADEARPGDEVSLVIFWRSQGSVAIDYRTYIELEIGGEEARPLVDAPPLEGGYPTSRWGAGRLVQDPYELRIPADAPAGDHRILLSLYDPATSVRLQARGPDSDGDAIALGLIRILERGGIVQAPRPQTLQAATFGEAAKLLGYDLRALEEVVAPGDEVSLTLYWKALGPTERPYTVFVHILDEEGNFRGQGDGPPCGGGCPTTGWVAGDYLADEHLISVDSVEEATRCQIEIGLYDPRTGQRLPAFDGDGRPLGDHLTLEGGGVGLAP